MTQPQPCLSRYCSKPAEYDVRMPGGWWWSQCAEHTAQMRVHLGQYLLAVETHDPDRPDGMAPRDVPSPKLLIEDIAPNSVLLRSRFPDETVDTEVVIDWSFNPIRATAHRHEHDAA